MSEHELNLTSLTDHDWLQIGMCAQGCGSGGLSEWPHLKNALSKAEIDLPPTAKFSAVRTICRLIYNLHTQPPAVTAWAVFDLCGDMVSVGQTRQFAIEGIHPDGELPIGYTCKRVKITRLGKEGE